MKNRGKKFKGRKEAYSSTIEDDTTKSTLSESTSDTTLPPTVQVNRALHAAAKNGYTLFD